MLLRLPKSGTAPSLVSEAGVGLAAVTTLGGIAYWLENPTVDGGSTYMVKSAPLSGGAVSLVAQFNSENWVQFLGVTSSTAFVGSELSDEVQSFPVTGLPSSGLKTVDASCGALASDTDAVYYSGGAWALAIASNGTTNSIGTVLESAGTRFAGLENPEQLVDDTSVYEVVAFLVDGGNLGSIQKTPKTGGATIVVAQGVVPTAIAVDARWLYWSDRSGFLKRVPK